MSTILVDVDGVCANFVDHCFNTLRGLGYPNDFSIKDVQDWDLFDLLPAGQKRILIDQLKNPLWWSTMPMLLGAKEIITSWQENGHDVVFVTSPWLSCDEWDARRRDWLRGNFGVDPHNVMCARRKDLITGDVFIDDKLEHVEGWAEKHPAGLAVVFDAPYNQGGSFVGLRSNNWPTIGLTVDDWLEKRA